MRLKDYAKLYNISYKTAHLHWKQGWLNGYQLPNKIIYLDDINPVKIIKDTRDIDIHDKKTNTTT